MEKDIPCKWKSKKAGVAILISDKIDFKIKTITRDKEGHYLMIKGSIQEEDITIVNIYAPNIGAPQYIRQILTAIKGEIDNNTISVGDFNTPLTSLSRSSRQNINKATVVLNDTIDQMVLIDIYSIKSKNNRIHILFKCLLNVLQDKSRARSQNKSQEI